MASEDKRPLKVFLCHASGDKPPVRDLYKRLTAEGVDAWLDQEKLLPGQDWRLEIPKAVQEADVVVVCLSKKSVTKEGYVQKEIKFALDIAEEKPEGTIFLIPARLEDCTVPERLSRWQWVDLFEEDGFVKLLRSLKLRADRVGAVIEPVSYEDSDREYANRLNQLYTDGLAAFYTEDWDKACHRFESILSEQPGHRHAAEKLAEADCQRKLAKLYARSMEAVQTENWPVAIETLEELLKKSADYRDGVQLLKDSRKRKELGELYAEATALHAAQKWQAVVKVFEQISAIEPAYSDADGLLASAQREVAELTRLEKLNNLYGQALREMDAGRWYEARSLMEQVHKSQTGFLETERLLRKVEDEIVQAEEQNRRHEQINILYEQAHGLLRAKKWRKALDKVEEIQGLDDQFVDNDGISDKAKTELAKEEVETQREDDLSARYAEAVRLLKEEKYQEALDKWQEVRAIDPKYPDRQWVGITAKRKLGGKPESTIEPKISLSHVPVGWLVFLAAVGFGLAGLVQTNLVPTEAGWVLRGGLQGLITALIIHRVIPEWKWRSLLTFIVCWAIMYRVTHLVIDEFRAPILTITAYSLAPALSFILLSIWTKRETQWQTYVLIFSGWMLAWLIGQNMAGYLNPVMHGSSLRWIFNDVLAGGIGLWITIDLLKPDLGEKIVDDSDVNKMGHAPGSANLLLQVFLGFVLLRTIWQFINDSLHVWEVPSPTPAQFIVLFFLGVCFGAVVAFSLKKTIQGWGLYHSLIVIAGWASGFGIAAFFINTEYNFDAVLMVISGLSMAGVVKLARPSMPPLKIILIFVFWWAAKMYGTMLGGYLRDNLGTQYVWGFTDAMTILLGLLGTYFVLDGDPKRLVKLSLLCALGFGAGNSLSVLFLNWMPLAALAVWGFVGGVIFVSLSRDWRKMLIKGGLCGLGLLLGGMIASVLLPDHGNVHNLIWGLGLGIALGLPTHRASVVTFLAILGSATFMMTSIYFSGAGLGEPWISTLRGAWIGLVLGFGYAYATKGLKTNEPAG